MEKIQAAVARFLRIGEGEFSSLALDLFGYQFERNGPYRVFCDAQGIKKADVKRWEEIPAVPTRAFKSAELTTVPPARAAAMFESSRTTGQEPSRHYLKNLSYYESACAKSFEQWMLPDHAELPFLILTPPPGEVPRSSLAWMFDTVKRRFAANGEYLVQRGRLDEPRLAQLLNRSQTDGQPVALMGTTMAFLVFFDYCQAKGLMFDLPVGSRLLDTGGMKGTQREVTRTAFVDQVDALLGIPEPQCINEYGMCEMSSQFYGRGRSLLLQGPPWVRTLVVEGCLRYFDLANVDSVMAIQTEDRGRLTSEGFEFLGRATGAELKGCSLAAETI